MDITEFDKNFLQAAAGGKKVEFHDALEAPFALDGFPFRQPGEKLSRLPAGLTEQTFSPGVHALAGNTSGGAIRFRAASPELYLMAAPASTAAMRHMPATGVSGYDFYYRDADGRWKFLKNAAANGLDPEKSAAIPARAEMTDYMLVLPLYSGVEKIFIGTVPGAALEPPTPYAIRDNLCFYGSSITQGGCASRPGNSYTAMLARELDAPQVNLGFSGSARGETALAALIARIPMALFVYDYDHNAPDADFLRATHAPFFRAIRAARPEVPVIMLSGCSRCEDARRDIIRQTYLDAVSGGDKKVWFIDGASLFREAGQEYCTVDGIHPNDLGFYMMFRTILPVAREALKTANG